MKKINILILIILCTSLSAQIFEVDRTKFLTITSVALALDLSNNYLDEKFIDKPSESELSSLSKDDIFSWDRNTMQPFSKELKNYSDYTAFATMGVVAYIVYDKDYWLDNLMVFSEIMIAQSAVAKWTKTFSGRYRPFVYDDDVNIAKKQEYNSQHSFYSMHSSTTFAASTFAYYYYSQNFGKNIPAAILIYSPSVATAALRVASGNHFSSDVIVGALVGSGISYFLCKWHRSESVVINLGYNQTGISVKF